MTNYLTRIFNRVLFASLLFLLSGLTSTPANGKEYHYQEQKGKEITSFTWKIKNSGGKAHISVLKNSNSYISTCNNDGSTRYWKMTDIKKGDFEVTRVNNLLNIIGKMDGEVYENSVGLNDKPWFQSPYYALGKFIDSSYRDISFWIFQEGNIEPVILNARKRGAESIVVNSKTIQAQKVEVRSDDFFSKLWRGFYWFREGDNRLVMYRSESGIPGIKDTIVTLTDNPPN